MLADMYEQLYSFTVKHSSFAR